MKKIVLLGELALSVLSMQAFADQKPLKFGIEAAYPPFASKAPDGSIVGFDYDIGNALCEQMQVKCTWVEQEFDVDLKLNWCLQSPKNDEDLKTFSESVQYIFTCLKSRISDKVFLQTF